MLAGTTTTVERMPAGLCKVYLLANPQGSCELEVVTTVGMPVLQQARALDGTTYCRTWKQLRHPEDGSKLWQFGHNGKSCYDGSTAWCATSKGVSGCQNCGYTQGIGCAVTIISCRESGNRSWKVRFDVTGQVCFAWMGSRSVYPSCRS